MSTNTEYDCLIQGSCVMNQQMHARTVPRVPMEVEGFKPRANPGEAKIRIAPSLEGRSW